MKVELAAWKTFDLPNNFLSTLKGYPGAISKLGQSEKLSIHVSYPCCSPGAMMTPARQQLISKYDL